MARPRILIVEDDQSLADVLSYNLTQAGYAVTLAGDGQDGLAKARLLTPEVVILDIMLPVIDGLEVCRQLRASPVTREILILMLTAKAQETDEVVGFVLGADDYVTKPFSVKVLLQRIKALRRRNSATRGAADTSSSQGVTVDRIRHRASVDGKPVRLTRTEFRLLDALLRQPGRAFSRAELIDAALGEDAVVLQRTIDVHIQALRHKLGSAAPLIETVRGIGYRFCDPVTDGLNDGG